MTEEVDEARRPQPWRWMILLARFFWSFISLGLFKSLGMFIPYFIDSFSVSTSTVGFACSAVIGIGMLISGPIVGALVKVWSPRQLTIVGGFLSPICLMMASFSSSIIQLFALFALSSVGLAFIQVASVPPLMDYFPDDFAFTNGLSFAGGSIGMMMIPLLAEYLVDMYGWRSAFGLLGAFSFNYIVCGALLRPVDRTSTATHYMPVASNPDVEHVPTMSTHLTGGEAADKNTQSAKSVFSQIVVTLRESFDTKLLTEPTFLLFQVVSVLEGMTFSMWHIFLIAQGVELGYGDTPSAVLATFGGFGSLIGRLTHGTLVDRDLMKASTLFILSSLVFSISNLLNPLAVYSYTALATVASVSGIAIGIFYPLTFVLMREITGDQHTSAYGWMFATHGTGQLLGGALAGWIHDVTQHYMLVFVAIGAIAVIMSAITMLMRCVVYFRKGEI